MTTETEDRGRLVPVARVDPAGPRSSIDMLASICQLLEENLAATRHLGAELRELNTNLRAASVSSVEFDSNGSAGKPKLKIKEYAESPVDAVVASVHDKFFAEMAALDQATADGWQVTREKAKAPRETEIEAGRRWADAQSGSEAADRGRDP